MQTPTQHKVTPLELADALEQNLYKIEFEKLDGTFRTMKCTRRTEFIPTDKKPKEFKPVLDTTTAIPVFDIDMKAWRSIRPSSVVGMEII